MQTNKVQVTFGSKTLYLKLNDNLDDLKKTIFKEFGLKEFIAEVEVNNKQKITIEFRNDNLIQKEEMLNINQLGCKSIKIIEMKDQKDQINNYQFYDAFVNGNEIQCCTRKDCQLCFGNGQAIIKENDYSFINEVIRNKLNERLHEISDIILKRDKKKITSPEDFLQYHLKIKSFNQEFMTITPENAFIHFQQDIVILQDDNLKAKIIEQQQLIEGDRGGEAVIQLKYKNDGFVNWPQKVQLVCIEGPFQIRQDIKSAIKQQTISQEIKIHIPDIPPNKYEFSCRFEYQNERGQKIQFGQVIKLILIVNEKNQKKLTNKLQNFDEQNRKLIPEIKNQLNQMGYYYFEQKMNDIFQKFFNQKLTLESFMNEFWNE
ncbi:unnamed protein product [Paramecium pentaurelia]|uniref:Uncharacterized protein n=1 Tax=Paramecium pentaurelia TaxID=43138 RepID=A0A8S1SEM4_9CILI|nr:unnamed protein product [Paramecium pentaurelia]